MCSPAQKITRSPWTRSSNYCILWCNHPTHGNRVIGNRAIILLIGNRVIGNWAIILLIGNRVIGNRAIILLVINLIPAIWRVLWQSKAGKSVHVKPGFQHRHKTTTTTYLHHQDVPKMTNWSCPTNSNWFCQNAALVSFSIPKPGEGFRLSVRYIENRSMSMSLLSSSSSSPFSSLSSSS